MGKHTPATWATVVSVKHNGENIAIQQADGGEWHRICVDGRPFAVAEMAPRASLVLAHALARALAENKQLRARVAALEAAPSKEKTDD